MSTTKKLTLVLSLGLALVLLACNPIRIDSRWPNGAPKQVSIIDGQHWDIAEETAATKTFCSLLEMCEIWDTYWQYANYRDCLGYQNSCTWVETGGTWESVSCGHYRPSFECQQLAGGWFATGPRG